MGLSVDPERTVVVPLTATDQGGASSPGDYSGVPVSVSFAAGETSKSFTFTAKADDVDDDGESVKLGLGTLPTGVTEGSPDESVVSIVDDDDPAVSVSFASGSYSAAEGGTVEVVVSLSVDPERTVVIPLGKTDQGGASAADIRVCPRRCRSRRARRASRSRSRRPPMTWTMTASRCWWAWGRCRQA